MKKIIQWFLKPPVTGPSSILVLRLMAGSIIFGEGILKLWYIRQDAGGLTRMDFDLPYTMIYITATFEVLSGLLLVLGLFTRITAFYIILQMLTALSLHIDSYFAGNALQFSSIPPEGMWFVLYNLRPYYAELLVCFFLLIEGAGRRSLDFKIYTSKKVYNISEK